MYSAFLISLFVEMFGLLLLTLAMAPVPIVAHVRQARREDAEPHARFGGAYLHYASRAAAFIPHLRARSVTTEQTGSTLG